ncbi:hypothetical protein OENI_20069 [Oenococcus oeni]|nr:hypothetical protein OENI_20069 [Oenococcus oeni]SYW08422.1 hypothetical protein OENI_260008 [Oenococcus oeni]
MSSSIVRIARLSRHGIKVKVNYLFSIKSIIIFYKVLLISTDRQNLLVHI